MSASPLRHDGRDGVRATLRLLRAADGLQKLCQRRFRDHGSTLPRFDVMAALEAAGEPIPMGGLSERLLVSNGAVTGVVASLVEAGLVRQENPPGDRRTRLVSLTPLGAERFAAMAAEHRRWMAQVFDALPEAELAALLTALTHVNAAIDARPPAALQEEDAHVPAFA